jgi:choline kinase
MHNIITYNTWVESDVILKPKIEELRTTHVKKMEELLAIDLKKIEEEEEDQTVLSENSILIPVGK